MPSQHRRQPVSVRLSESLESWLTVYASSRNRTMRAVIIEAIEEYRYRHEEGVTGMQPLTTELATDYLYRAFKTNFLQPGKMAWYPINFPGVEYRRDGSLTPAMMTKGTQHLVRVLDDNGCVVRFSDGTDPKSALHHVLWDRWTQAEIGSGRFVGCLFDEHGLIYKGKTSDDAARHTVERVLALGGTFYCYTK